MTAATRQDAGRVADETAAADLRAVADANAAFLAEAGLLDAALAGFFAECERVVAACGRAIADGDAAVRRRTAHGLRGAAGLLGAEAIFARATELESCPADAAPAALAALRTAIDARRAGVTP